MISEVLLLKTGSDNVGLHLIDEWADEFSKCLNVPVRIIGSAGAGKPSVKKSFKSLVKSHLPAFSKPVHIIRGIVTKPLSAVRRFVTRHIRPPFFQDLSSPLAVYFAINPTTVHVHFPQVMQENCIPIFLDVSVEEADDLIRTTRNMKLFYVTSRTVFNYIKTQAPNSNVRYMPLSVPDKYHSENFRAYRKKTIDVIQLGRRNSILHGYMLRYCGEHKNIDYVYASNGTKFGSMYTSTTRGDLGAFVEREKFIGLLSSAKVSLTATSASDPNPVETLLSRRRYPTPENKRGFVSPRFYESAILGCALIGLYADNEEFTKLNMRKYCPNITSYEHFCESLERALAQSPEELYDQNHDFIINSLTSKRAEQIQHDLEELSCTNS